MSSVLETAVSEPPAIAADSSNASPNTLAARAPLFRFGLRQLFWFVAILCGLLTALSMTHGLAAGILLLAALIIGAHLFATALGSRLRERADRAQGWGEPHWRQSTAEVLANRQVGLEYAKRVPRSPWHGHATDLRWLPKLVGAAGFAGAVGGFAVLGFTARQATSFGGLMVGSVSLAVLAGWGAFLFGSFYAVFRHGFHEALAEQKKDERPHSSSR